MILKKKSEKRERQRKRMEAALSEDHQKDTVINMREPPTDETGVEARKLTVIHMIGGRNLERSSYQVSGL